MIEDSGVHSQSHSYSEPARTFFDVANSVLSDMVKTIDRSDELTNSGFSGMKTIFSLLGKQFEEGGNNIIASVRNRKERINSAEVQSLTQLERTFFNIWDKLLGASSRNANNEIAQKLVEPVKEIFMLLGKGAANAGDTHEITHEID